MAYQAHPVAVGVGEHRDAADGRVHRCQYPGAAQLFGGGQGRIHVLDREAGDQPDVRAAWRALPGFEGRSRGDRIAEIVSFLGAEHFAPFGLPAALG
nr:hypothetical protein [Actinocatenispora sera]